MLPRIVVEGPDGSGKSTLIGRIQTHFESLGYRGLKVRERACTSEDGPVEGLSTYVDRYLEDHTGGIWDRHPLISEPIYGPIIRGHIHPSFTNYTWLSSSLSQFYAYEPMIIYCLPPWWAVMDNIQKTHQGDTEHMKGVVQHAMAIYDMYMHKMALDLYRPGVWFYDYTVPINYNRILGAIRDRWDGR